MDYTAGQIDPHRPWIRDERDAPAAMNWGQTLFNPMGETSKLHFTRAWTMMFMGRILLYIVPSVIVSLVLMAGVKAQGLVEPVDMLLLSMPAMLVPFVLFTLVTEYTSFVAHVRRLADARRPVWLAGLVVLPMILGLAFYMLGAQGGAAQYRASKEAPAAEAAAAGDAVTEVVIEADAATAPTQTAAPKGPSFESERAAAVAGGTGAAMSVWALTSFGVMLWTLLYVARLPNGGVGKIRTGSDLTAEEAASGV